MLTTRIMVYICLIFIGTTCPLNAKDTSDILPIDLTPKEILDSAKVLYIHSQYIELAQYLESFDSNAFQKDSLDLDYYYRITMAYGHLEWHDKMFESVVKGLLLAQKYNNKWMLLAFYRELGSFHDMPLDDQETGLIYMKKAIPYLDVAKEIDKCGLMMDIGLTSVNAGQLDSAKYYYDLAFGYLPDDPIMKADLYSFYIPYLLKSNQLDSIEYYNGYANKKWKEIGFQQGYTESFIYFAELYFRKGLYQQALDNAQIAITKAQEIPNINLLSQATKWQAKSEDELALVKESLASYKTLNQLRDSIDIISKEQKLEKRKAEFVALIYKDELAQINAYNEELTNQMSFSKKVSLCVLLLLASVSLAAYYLLKRRKEKISELTDVISLSKETRKKLQEEYQIAIHKLEKNKRELTSSALFIEKKNEALKSVRKMLSNIKGVQSVKVADAINSARKLADISLNIDNNWESFRYFFEQIYPSFYIEIKKSYPILNQNELRYLSYLKIGLTDKESARLLGINTASYQKSKYRLKKKLNLPKEEMLVDMLEQF